MDHRALTGAITSVLGSGGGAVLPVIGRVTRAPLEVRFFDADAGFRTPSDGEDGWTIPRIR
jgi:hypothetical protein